MKTLSIVIPCFNSAENIADLQVALEALSKQLSGYMLEIILVDDGSKDDTYKQLTHLSETISLKTVLVKLTGNFGSYNAFLAGLHQGSGDVYAYMHPDMQDPPEHIPEMISYWEKGIPYVIGLRTEREEGFFHRSFSHFYHWLIKKIALPHIPDGGFDLILFDKALRDHVVCMNESNTNLVYLISWLQYPYVTIPIKRVSRKKGKSQWTLNKKLKLLTDSIVSFSYTPIRLVTLTALCVLTISFFLFIYLLLTTKVSNEVKLLAGLLLLFGNITLLFISIIGEYLWRNLEAARKRPPFIVEKINTSNP